MIEQIKTIIVNHPIGGYSMLKKANLIGELMLLTSFLDDKYKNIPTSQRFWHIINDKFEIINCNFCGVNPARYHKTRKYSTCSEQCQFDKINQNCEEIHGVNHPSQIKSVKDARINTCKERYGVDNFAKSDLYTKKTKKTNKERYGVDWVSKTDEHKNKSKATCKERYGVDFITQSDEFKEKSILTNKERYGVDNVAKSEIIKNITKQSCLKKFKVDNFSKTKRFKILSGKQNHLILLQKIPDGYSFINKTNHSFVLKHNYCGGEFEIKRDHYRSRKSLSMTVCTICSPIGKNWSNGEKELSNYIRLIYGGKIIENDRILLKPKELDIYLPEIGLAFEFNGTYSHADPRKYKSNSKIHYKIAKDIWAKDILKANLCKAKGVDLITIWELDWVHDNETVLETVKNTIINKYDKVA